MRRCRSKSLQLQSQLCFRQMGPLNAMTDNVAMQTVTAGARYGPANELLMEGPLGIYVVKKFTNSARTLKLIASRILNVRLMLDCADGLVHVGVQSSGLLAASGASAQRQRNLAALRDSAILCFMAGSHVAQSWLQPLIYASRPSQDCPSKNRIKCLAVVLVVDAAGTQICLSVGRFTSS